MGDHFSGQNEQVWAISLFRRCTEEVGLGVQQSESERGEVKVIYWEGCCSERGGIWRACCPSPVLSVNLQRGTEPVLITL